MENITKALKAFSAILVILISFGMLLSSNIRSNFFELVEPFLSPLGVILLFIFFWPLRDIRFTLQKLIKQRALTLNFGMIYSRIFFAQVGNDRIRAKISFSLTHHRKRVKSHGLSMSF